MKKLTDKMRLDFLGRTKSGIYSTVFQRGKWIIRGYVIAGRVYDESYKTPRQAIDAAIRSERSARKGGGNK